MSCGKIPLLISLALSLSTAPQQSLAFIHHQSRRYQPYFINSSQVRALSLVNSAFATYNERLVVQRRMSSYNEVDAASIAASTDPAINPSALTFFDKIVSKEIPSQIIHEDDLCLAFRDINPQGPIHFLVIPKKKDGLNRLSNAREDQKELLGHLVYTAQRVAHQEGLVPGGFRLVINDGPLGAQSVYHLHVHVIGGRQMTWPPG